MLSRVTSHEPESDKAERVRREAESEGRPFSKWKRFFPHLSLVLLLQESGSVLGRKGKVLQIQQKQNQIRKRIITILL